MLRRAEIASNRRKTALNQWCMEAVILASQTGGAGPPGTRDGTRWYMPPSDFLRFSKIGDSGRSAFSRNIVSAMRVAACDPQDETQLHSAIRGWLARLATLVRLASPTRLPVPRYARPSAGHTIRGDNVGNRAIEIRAELRKQHGIQGAEAGTDLSRLGEAAICNF
jgi:hypothetical protein